MTNHNENRSPDADNYAGLITVFSVLLAVEYASGAYDVWDIFVATICIFMGYKYRCKVKDDLIGDAWYRFFTACLMSFGVLSGFSGVIGMGYQIREFPDKVDVPVWVESLRFLVFLVLAFVIFFLYVPRNKQGLE